MSGIVYARETALPVEDFRKVLMEAGPGLTRPVDDPDRLRRMIEGAQLVVTARRDGEIVGLARCITDFSWNCYLNELAVSQAAQGLGIGKGLIDKVREILGPEVSLKLTSANRSRRLLRKDRHAAQRRYLLVQESALTRRGFAREIAEAGRTRAAVHPIAKIPAFSFGKG